MGRKDVYQRTRDKRSGKIQFLWLRKLVYTLHAFPFYTMIIRRFIALLSLFGTLAPVTAFALTEAELSESDKRAIFRPCETVDSDAVERCKARQLAKVNIGTSSERRPTDALNLYKSLDLGGAQKKSTAIRTRADLLKELRKSRTTYKQYDPTTDPLNAQKSYIGDLRKEKLQCQLMPAGRPKSICFDQVAQKYRKVMKNDEGVGTLLRKTP